MSQFNNFSPQKSELKHVVVNLRKQTDFSIESILRKDNCCTTTTNTNTGCSNFNDNSSSEFETLNFSWLNCSRFKPPKLPRSEKKKKLGGGKKFRGARIPFGPQQISILEKTFEKSQYLSSDSIQQLAQTLCLTETRVKIWFQNRRARSRREVGNISIIKSNDPKLFTPVTESQAPAATFQDYYNLINYKRFYSSSSNMQTKPSNSINSSTNSNINLSQFSPFFGNHNFNPPNVPMLTRTGDTPKCKSTKFLN